MFLPNSRYANAGIYTIRTNSGVSVTVVRAAHYLADATAFWRLCDAGDATAPDAHAVRDDVAIPTRDL
jgi:hypothetical protein